MEDREVESLGRTMSVSEVKLSLLLYSHLRERLVQTSRKWKELFSQVAKVNNLGEETSLSTRRKSFSNGNIGLQGWRLDILFSPPIYDTTQTRLDPLHFNPQTIVLSEITPRMGSRQTPPLFHRSPSRVVLSGVAPLGSEGKASKNKSPLPWKCSLLILVTLLQAVRCLSVVLYLVDSHEWKSSSSDACRVPIEVKLASHSFLSFSPRLRETKPPLPLHLRLLQVV